MGSPGPGGAAVRPQPQAAPITAAIAGPGTAAQVAGAATRVSGGVVVSRFGLGDLTSSAGNAAGSAMNSASNAASSAVSDARETASGAASDAVSDAVSSASGAAHNAVSGASDVAHRAVASAVPGAAPGGAGGAGGPGQDLDDLARKLYDRLRGRLATELRLDRERSGCVTDLPR